MPRYAKVFSVFIFLLYFIYFLQFVKIISHKKKIDYNMLVLLQYACQVPQKIFEYSRAPDKRG